MKQAPYAYVSTYCNFAHRCKDGKPIQHECRIIPPKALEAEMNDDISLAIEILSTTPARIMRRGVKF
jgi:hypothetical protein